MINSDVVSLTVTAANFDKNVGTGKTVTATGLSLTGADAVNYQLSSTTATTPADITGKSVTPHITANNKVYDGTTAATLTSQTLTGVIGGDVVSLTVTAANFDTKDVGTGKTVTATGLGLSGADAGNYQLTSTTATATADITAKLAVPHITASDKVYDGTTAATILTRTLTGVLAADEANVSLTGGTATFADPNVGNGKTVTATGLSLSGTAAGNYELSSTTATTTANITLATPGVSVTGGTYTYDGSPHAASGFAYGVGGVTDVLTPAVTLSYTGTNATSYGPAPAPPVNAGTYSATAWFAGNANYSAASSSAGVTINKASSVTTVTVANATYDGGPHGGTAVVTGVGGLNQPLTVTYAGINGTTYLSSTVAPVNVGAYSASAVYAGDGNHNGSSDSKSFTIEAACATNVSISSDFNGTPIAAGNRIWFNSVLKPSGLGSKPVTIRFLNQSITSAKFNISLPDAEIIFDPAAATATTIFDGTKWVTRVPSSGLSGNTFLSGFGYQVPGNLPGGINPVTWKGTFVTDTPGVTIQWKWAAAVYTSFSPDPNGLGVKPVDDSRASSYQNSDHAGTPENFKAYVTGGTRGGGGSNYTGSLSSTGSVQSCTGTP